MPTKQALTNQEQEEAKEYIDSMPEIKAFIKHVHEV
jgi:hypothetical protein